MSAAREISPALRGIACVAGACLLLTMADAFAKLLTETQPVMEIALLRSTVQGYQVNPFGRQDFSKVQLQP